MEEERSARKWAAALLYGRDVARAGLSDWNEIAVGGGRARARIGSLPKLVVKVMQLPV